MLTRFEAKPWTEPVVETIASADDAVALAWARPAVSFFRDHPYALLDAWRDVGIPFAELELRSRRKALAGVEVAIVDADDWRRLKELANREKDRADLEAFQKPSS
ncbi:MAG TPA: hypothetical protein VFB62_08755 [Polyangiaceae bacterium]|nr:hypothetical protein [Polyangiaceae bacterium]